MKKIFSLLFIAVFVLSCSTDGYKIEGSFPAAPDGTMVYMLNPNDELAVVDSAVVRGGEFEFSGGLYERSVRMLLAESEAVGGPVVLEPGKIVVNIDEEFVRGGTEGNEILQRFVVAKSHLENLEHATSPAFVKTMSMGKAMLDSLVDARKTAESNFMEYSLLAIEGNIDNGLGFYMISQVYQRMEIERLAQTLSRVPLYLHSSRFDVINSYVEHRLAAELRKRVMAVGQIYQNFELPDLSDKKVLFSDVVSANRYTLLQFWASWCAPCRAELPAIEKLHAKYRKRGVAVVGLSLDSDAEECRAAVSALGLSFMQLCNPDGGSSEVATAYGVDAIPSNILINRDGKIIARNLSPAELDTLIGNALR